VSEPIPRLQLARRRKDISGDSKNSRGFGCSDAGVGLMRVESDVMVDVTRKLLADGVAILPVHDAAIVQARHYGLAKAAMVEAFERRTGVAGVTVRRKG
jgi:hypothetical protein